MFEIGDVVYAFDTESTKPSVFKTVVVGRWINIESGDLYYYLFESKQPAYSLSKTKEEAEEKLQKFYEFRKFIADQQEAVYEKKKELFGEQNYKDFLDNILAEHINKKAE